MSRQEIHVTFDPEAENGDAFSFSPDRAVLTRETATVDVILHTAGGGDAKAIFAQPEGIVWITEGPSDLAQTANDARTVLTLRGFPMNEVQETINHGYAVVIDYQGRTIPSPESEYPEMSCGPTGNN